MKTVATASRYRESHLLTGSTVCERRPDGAWLLRSQVRMPVLRESCMGDFVQRWASERADLPAIQARCSTQQGWRGLSWRVLWQQVQSVAASLLSLGLGPGRPIMLLTDNSVEQLVVVLAAEYVGVPSALVPPTYARHGADMARLQALHELLEPAAVFVQDADACREALAALKLAAHEVIAVQSMSDEHVQWPIIAQRVLLPEHTRAVAQARAALRLEQVARIFFTPSAAGMPRGVPMSYGNLQAFFALLTYRHGEAQPPVLLDGLPWSQVHGGLGSLGRLMVHGGRLYIDDGRATPELFELTLRNIRDVSPSLFVGMPKVWDMLLTALEQDSGLARKFFQNLQYMSFGSADLPHALWVRIQALAEQAVGERIVFAAGYGSAETGALGSGHGDPGDDASNMGMPYPGVVLKLVPMPESAERYEVRMRGPTLFAGYLKRPDLTVAAFDEEGFYSLGETVSLIDPSDPTCGMRYAGGMSEEQRFAHA